MSSINSNEIISILKEEIENFDMMSKDSEVGTVITVGDGIASIYGIDHAMYGEIVTFENGLKGMVQDIRRNEIGCILFGSDTRISEGTKVTRTGKRAGVPVGDAYIGRVVNALGEPIDGKGSIEADGYRPIEQEAPGIVDRKSVSVPMETGILSIDSMFPIGRGQRELIIGDRQTGKTSIALDTILNQKDKDVIKSFFRPVPCRSGISTRSGILRSNRNVSMIAGNSLPNFSVKSTIPILLSSRTRSNACFSSSCS